MHPAEFLYSTTRKDWDDNLASERREVEKVSFAAMLVRVLRRDYTTIEVPEPLAISLLPQTALIALLLKLRATVRREPAAKLVFYAIENLDQTAKVQARLPLPRWLLQPMITLGVSTVLTQTARVAFGTAGALDNYREQVGRARWERMSKKFDCALIPGLSSPSAESPPKAAGLACFVGAFESRKGITSVMQAWPLAAQIRPGSQLAIAGHGELEPSVRAFAASRSDVTLMVDPPRREIRSLLARAHALILPSRRTPVWREQIGLPILEGLSAGCEIVTTDETGISDWLRLHEHTVLNATQDVSELASAIADVLGRRRSADVIKADLPDQDGRIVADQWLFAPRPEAARRV
jgi:glycosyltransferase involved in cell wall biosynthesis